MKSSKPNSAMTAIEVANKLHKMIPPLRAAVRGLGANIAHTRALEIQREAESAVEAIDKLIVELAGKRDEKLMVEPRRDSSPPTDEQKSRLKWMLFRGAEILRKQAAKGRK